MNDNDTHSYDNIGKDTVTEIFKVLAAHGSTITGENPWSVATNNHGVKLIGEWNESGQVLTITVIGADWYVPRTTIWENIDSLMRRIQDAS